MGYFGFILIILIIIILASMIILTKGIKFIDTFVVIMTALMALSFDMIYCKQLATYHYVSYDNSGINSLIVGLLVFPSIWIIFISYKPKSKVNTILYILLWSMILTVLEIYVTKPYNIVLYPKWEIIPWSPIVYVLSFVLLLGYRNFIYKKIN
ncbi:hypothetical protein GOQ27_13800 [Clostridium sp. D2Q-11]|uniref:Uncharacterized protein n=1 Tax=Anaeromonas frigoriresistens TaxID=2683708 RepID=A0A942UXS5_9FIRM|nr:hypothetical protein [Anaeromonas frigoriresistens]MBS4539545.1 hypothetical protein [Anaeromonas frigoriresistens]